ncbi:MAG TPA: sodium-translocating pyrophosphatase, partial [Phycisphaerales bacterium]|nr:sodium-translocating pyrophosphatase [Phycisphaerales bacterium]
MASSVFAHDESTPAAVANQLPGLFWIAPVGAIAALVMAFVFYKGFMATSEGDANMAKIAQAVREGAYAYLGRQAKVVYAVVAVLAIVLLIMGQTGLQENMTWLGVIVASVLSGFCGFLGMKTATNASARTANAAKNSLNDGLKVAFRAGAVMGLCVTGFALADVSAWFIILSKVKGLGDPMALSSITTLTLSFAMGASLQALFARVGGGIYTKAADVGADLVGKVEAGIPEDDARNPATIADNVGDNVGDVAGMGADLYESYYGSILAAMALAAAAAIQLKLGSTEAVSLIIAAPCLAGLGILCSIFSIFCVRAKENASFAQLLKSLHMGVWISSALIIIGSYFILQKLVGNVEGISALGIWGAIISGLVGGLVIAWGTERYTSYEHKPTQRIAEQAKMGPATVIISGIAEGMISTWIPLLTVVVAIMCAFSFAGGHDNLLMGVFGVGIAAVGMLSTLGITLATDAYGPIADNAGGNAEMTHQPPHVRERTDMLDSLGNTTAATGKGFAIGSAALTALALLAAYVTTVQAQMTKIFADNPEAYGGFNPGTATIKDLMNHLEITLMNPAVLCGLFVGVMLVMVFCAMTMNAVGRAAFAMIDECRRQFGIMKGGFKKAGMSDADVADPMKWPMEVEVDGKMYPDYANCVAISTGGALKEMVIPSLLAVVVPIIVGLILGVPGVMGLLAGTLVCG